METLTRSWLRRFTPRPTACYRIYCLPFAGGAASAYRTWASAVPADCELVSVQLPGREDRYTEPPLSELGVLERLLADIIERDAAGRPYALFGHSMGALLSYGTAREMRARSAPPRLLAVSGRRPPHVVGSAPVLSQLGDAELIEALLAAGGIPPELADERDLLEYALPMLRADLSSSEGYTHAPGALLDFPIAVFAGRDDAMAPPADLAAWGDLTTAGASVREFPGGHFYLWQHSAEILRDVVTALRCGE
jgi:medium-chain acyl-[acyl-carrier-protein] hydrolase